MTIELAGEADLTDIAKLDSHIPIKRLRVSVAEEFVYVLRDDVVVGILRYSLFWQTIPFLDLLYIDERYRMQGFGRRMMTKWEARMKELGHKYVMTSTQADEEAWRFYEKLGYYRSGGFFPPEQTAEEIIYLKQLT
ncbi:MAG: GNAT family N-acetyltransferase [Clostridia bacterium]|nr:GNAT family N-acetyltransferase [Clostridia bacterium]